MFSLIFGNAFLWVNLIILSIIVILLFFLSEEYNILEVLGQIGLTFVILIISYAISYNISFDILSNEILNGKVTSFEFQEHWTEEVHHTETYTDSKGNTHTRHYTTYDYHPDKYYLNGDFGDQRIDKNIYMKALSSFNNEKQTGTRHSGQHSSGDGRTYQITVNNDVIATSTTHTYTNWIKASKQTIFKKTGNEKLLEKYKNYLIDYPTLSYGNYTQDYFDRVINFTDLTKDDIKIFEENLNKFCAINSKNLQFNVIVYFIPTLGRDFKQALDIKWKGANKNDTILIVSVKDKKIDYIDTISFTKNGNYFSGIKDMEGCKLTDKGYRNFCNKITENITKNWKRIPMKEFEYLKEDLVLSWKTQLIIIIINIICNIGLALVFLTNDFRKYD